MTIDVLYRCGGCDAQTEVLSIRQTMRQVSALQTLIETPTLRTAAPPGWVAFDPYTGVCYCPKCWAEIMQPAERSAPVPELTETQGTPGSCGGRASHRGSASALMLKAADAEAQAQALRQTFSFTWHGEPLPKPRPRVARHGGVYVSKRYAAFEQELAWAFREAIASAPLQGDVTLDARFYRKSTRRADGDNFLKATLDSGQGIAWVDDSQVIDVHYRVSPDPQNPRIEVRFGPDMP